MHLLIYFCATSIPDMNVLNPKGSKLSDLNEIPESEVMKLKRTDVFLEKCSGDYYSFNKEQKIWLPLGNTGLHHT